MSEDANQDNQGRELWRRYAAQAEGRPGPVARPELDPNALAAYLSGTAEPEVIERIEARMASDPALLEEVMKLRALAGMEAEPVPGSVLRKAKALAPGHTAAEPAGVVRGPERDARRVDTPTRAVGWWRRVQWAAAAAAVVVACLSGYSFGGGTFRAQRRAQAATAAAASLGLDELISGPAMGMPRQGNGGNGG